MDRIGASSLSTRAGAAQSNSRGFPRRRAGRRRSEEGLLVRAADFIGQPGDPHYLRKANALYYESRRSERIGSLATPRPPISPPHPRSIGTAFRHISRQPFDIERYFARATVDRRPLQQCLCVERGLNLSGPKRRRPGLTPCGGTREYRRRGAALGGNPGLRGWSFSE